MFIDIEKPGHRGSIIPNVLNYIQVRVNSLPLNNATTFDMKVEIKITDSWQPVETVELSYIKDGNKVSIDKTTKFKLASATGTYILGVTMPNNKEIKEMRIRITGFNSEGGETKQIFSHPISVSSTDRLEFTISEPSIANSLVTRVRTVLDMEINKPESLQIEVYATNNPFDDSPVWEDISASIFNGTYAQLENKEVEKGFGLNLKVILTKKQTDAHVIIHSLNYVFY